MDEGRDPRGGDRHAVAPPTHTKLKALLDVAGKPILAHILGELVALGIDEVVLVVGHLGERIEPFARERGGEPAGSRRALADGRPPIDD